MKKHLIVLLSLLILFSLSACDVDSETAPCTTDASCSESRSENATTEFTDNTESKAVESADETDREAVGIEGDTENSTVDSEGASVSEETERKNETDNTVPDSDGEKKSETAGLEGETESEKKGSEATETETEIEDETESPYLAPDFTVYDLEGNAVKLSDFRGKPIVVNVWASTCGPCKAEMPEFQEAYEKYGGEVQFLMIDYIGFFGEKAEDGKAYVDGQGYTFPVYFDSDNDAARTYGINAIPFTMFITKDFDLYTYFTGMTDFETLEKYINLIK